MDSFAVKIVVLNIERYLTLNQTPDFCCTILSVLILISNGSSRGLSQHQSPDPFTEDAGGLDL